MRNGRSDAGLARPGAGRAVIAVAAVIALVTVGWPLAGAAFSDREPLTAGSALAIGPDRAHSGRLTVGPGWTLLKAESDQRRSDILRRGPVELTVTFISLLSGGQAADLWAGLTRVLQAGQPGARLGSPEAMPASPAEFGDEGSLTEAGMAGEAEVLADPAAGFAIELTVVGPRGADAAGMRAAARVVRSLRIGAP
ncbi:MAG TPA: hypothetical protein VGH88_10680 [Streptosporangiaceae bacterium]